MTLFLALLPATERSTAEAPTSERVAANVAKSDFMRTASSRNGNSMATLPSSSSLKLLAVDVPRAVVFHNFCQMLTGKAPFTHK
eukprot:CAMPEP_0115653744 /NCGR_PEP_ID=MMETSP0272-20121206/42754_1 /TAXON_ID=71861 /ORGANISM="Scrippsiella trochoidea, Strain CCMP3099" /LENGTH=83 /DNA_ID=CAMNT_0003091613 /DNA_START=770 /DNA_END=1022 /DNA_ORIENTATION=+